MESLKRTIEMKANADKEEDLRIVELRAENFMRLHAVRIRPDGNMVEITGKNDAGKSSTITAVAWALGGKEFAVAMPLRKGEDRGEVFVDLGRLKVTKAMKRNGDDVDIKLTVEFRDGSRPRSPQAVLDELRGHLLDPIAFIRAKGPERVEMVKQLVPEFDFATNERAREKVFKDRTDVNRDHKRAVAAREAIRLPPGTKPGRVVIADASAQLAEINRANEITRQRRLRRECIGRRSCLEMTARETKQARVAAGLAIAALFLVALELWMHYVVGHMLVPKPR